MPAFRVELTDVERSVATGLNVNVALGSSFLPPSGVGVSVEDHAQLIAQSDWEESWALFLIKYQDHEDSAGFVTKPVRAHGTKEYLGGTADTTC